MSVVGILGIVIILCVYLLNWFNMVSVGIIVWLFSELMFFVGLFVFYFLV